MGEMGLDPSQAGRYTNVNGIEMYYQDHGEGEELVLLHGGLGTSLAHWKPYLPAFSKEYRVIAPDCRGHGRTNNPTDEWSYGLMADDIAALISVLGLQRPSICGWSDGGQIALELAMRYPGLARAYIFGAVGKDFSDVYLQTLKGWGFEGPGTVNISQMEKASPEYVEIIRELHSSQGAEYWEKLLNGISKMWLTPLNYTNEDFLQILEPVLIVIGDRDQFIPVEDAVAMYRLISNGELSIVPDADHSLPRTKVDIFADIVMEFLNRNRPETISAQGE